jgi:hypothetical protein
MNRLASRLIAAVACVWSLVALHHLSAAGPSPRKEPTAAQPAAPRVRVTISKETTYITEPLRKDGYVDYAGALNERLKRGVTPENNAAVLFWRALGPASIPEPQRAAVFKLLGSDVPPANGEYLVSLQDYVGRQKSANLFGKVRERELDAAYELDGDPGYPRPWSKHESPVLAEWLAVNEKPLELFVAATQRPRKFEPIILSPDHCLYLAAGPPIQQYRNIARALVARAMLRAADRNDDAAWDDLLAVHRLGRLTAQGAELVDGLVGFGIDGLACAGDQALMQHRQISASRAAKMLKDLDGLPAMPKMVEKIDLAERFMFLDLLGYVARNGSRSFIDLTMPGEPTHRDWFQAGLEAFVFPNIDWDLVMREQNRWYDRIKNSLEIPEDTARGNALAKMDDEIRRVRAESRDWKTILPRLVADPKGNASRWASDYLGGMFLPPLCAIDNSESRATTVYQLTRLGFALAAYRAEHGAYPTKLGELAPKYVSRIPKDLFSGSDLIYKVAGDGYLIYSVGVNGRDDGGNGYNDATNGEDWDDLSFRVIDRQNERRDRG